MKDEEGNLIYTYDRERIERFIRDTLGFSDGGADEAATEAAAGLLLDLLDDIEQGRGLKPRFTHMGYRKARANKFSPDRAALTGPEVEVAWRYSKGEIKRKDALAELLRLHPASHEQAVRYLKSLEALVNQHKLYIEMLVAWGREQR